MADDTSFCSADCQRLDSRLAFTRNSLILITLGLLTYVIIATTLEIVIMYSAMLISGMTLIVLFPLYQFYQSLHIERKLKITYKEKKYGHLKESDTRPVYIFLHINRY
ncbi:MAG: hypothetical protein ACXAE3_16120, partial [Candidatus Kariarchaeaceae archaeon]